MLNNRNFTHFNGRPAAGAPFRIIPGAAIAVLVFRCTISLLSLPKCL